MDVTKINTSLDAAQAELNNVIDAEFKARRLGSLRPLDLASKAIQLAKKHVETAVERTKEKAPAAEGTAAAAPAGRAARK